MWHKIYISEGEEKIMLQRLNNSFFKLMATEKTNADLLRQQIETLNEQYDMALRNGDEFSILRNIREQLKLLQQHLSTNGNSIGNDNDEEAQL